MKFSFIRFDDFITRAKKTTFLYLSVRQARVRVLFFHRFGRSWVQTIGLLTPSGHFYIFSKFRLETGVLEEKVKKRFFEWAKSGKHGYFCVTPTGLPDNFSGFYYLFSDRRHVTDLPFLSVKLCKS